MTCGDACWLILHSAFSTLHLKADFGVCILHSAFCTLHLKAPYPISRRDQFRNSRWTWPARIERDCQLLARLNWPELDIAERNLSMIPLQRNVAGVGLGKM